MEPFGIAKTKEEEIARLERHVDSARLLMRESDSPWATEHYYAARRMAKQARKAPKDAVFDSCSMLVKNGIAYKYYRM